MSFLLRNDIGRRKPLANRPSGQFPALRQSASNFVRRDAGGSSGERQSMVQIHRPPANAVQVQQQQSQSLTMKEVMSDLQILHEQQQEGQRQLDQARLIKQRRVEQYTVCEEKLRTLNYQHGQDRAYQKDLSEKLSIVQRVVGSAKHKAAKSNKDIAIFERKLHQAIETKRRLLSHHRGNRLYLVKLHDTLTFLKSKLDQRNANCNALLLEYDKLQSLDRSFRQSRDEKALTIQRIAGESFPLRAEHMKLQNEIDEQLQKSTNLKAQIVSLKQRIEDTVTQRKAAADHGDKLTESHKETLFQMDMQAATEQTQNKKRAETIKFLEREIATFKEVARLESTGSDNIHLNLALIQESIQAEQQSLEDERNSSRNVQADIAAFRIQLSKVQADTARAQKSVAEKKKGLAEAKDLEELRQIEYKELTDRLDAKRHEISTLEKAYEEEKVAKHQRTSALDKERVGIGADIASGESRLAKIKECLQETVTATNAAEIQLQGEMHQSLASMESWKEKLETEKTKNRSLCDKESSKSKELTALETRLVNLKGNGGNFENMSSVEYKAAIAQLINEYPILQSIRVTGLSKDGDFESLAKHHLQPVLEHCDDRIKSAQKMSRALKASAKRKEEEYQRSKKAAEAEEERQRLHREKRKKRLELEHSKNSQLSKKPRNVEEKSEAKNISEGNGLESAARPRELLSAFTLASFDAEKAESRRFNKATDRAQREIRTFEEEPLRTSDEIAKATSSSDKKVHWGKSSHKSEQKNFGVRSRSGAYQKHSRDTPSSYQSKTATSKDRPSKVSLKSADRLPIADRFGTKGSPTISDLSIEGGKTGKVKEKIKPTHKEHQRSDRVRDEKVLDKQKSKEKSTSFAEGDRGKVASHSSKQTSKKVPDRSAAPETSATTLPMYIDISKSKPSTSSKHQSMSSKQPSSVQSARKRHPEDANRKGSRPQSKDQMVVAHLKESPSKRKRGDNQASQTTGNPSNERQSQSRRRVRSKTASASKITLQSFKNDVSFNFR